MKTTNSMMKKLSFPHYSIEDRHLKHCLINAIFLIYFLSILYISVLRRFNVNVLNSYAFGPVT